MNNLHDRLERACDVMDDLGDHDARDAVIEAGKLLGELVTQSDDKINKILESAPIVGMYNDAEKFIDDYNKWKDKMFKEHYNG